MSYSIYPVCGGNPSQPSPVPPSNDVSNDNESTAIGISKEACAVASIAIVALNGAKRIRPMITRVYCRHATRSMLKEASEAYQAKSAVHRGKPPFVWNSQLRVLSTRVKDVSRLGPKYLKEVRTILSQGGGIRWVVGGKAEYLQACKEQLAHQLPRYGDQALATTLRTIHQKVQTRWKLISGIGVSILADVAASAIMPSPNSSDMHRAVREELKLIVPSVQNNLEKAKQIKAKLAEVKEDFQILIVLRKDRGALGVKDAQEREKEIALIIKDIASVLGMVKKVTKKQLRDISVEVVNRSFSSSVVCCIAPSIIGPAVSSFVGRMLKGRLRSYTAVASTVLAAGVGAGVTRAVLADSVHTDQVVAEIEKILHLRQKERSSKRLREDEIVEHIAKDALDEMVHTITDGHPLAHVISPVVQQACDGHSVTLIREHRKLLMHARRHARSLGQEAIDWQRSQLDEVAKQVEQLQEIAEEELAVEQRLLKAHRAAERAKELGYDAVDPLEESA